MFRALICPSSGARDYSVELSHWSCVLGSMCVGSFGVIVLEWYQCCRLKPVAGYRLKPAAKNNTTNVVIQQNSRKFLMMDILMSETC